MATVPGLRKAVKWNSPLYGVGDQGWFLDIHEHGQLDEAQLKAWVKQASQLPGERM